MRWARHVARMEEPSVRNLFGKRKGNKIAWNTCLDGRKILKQVLKGIGWEHVGWIKVAVYIDQWQVLVDVAMKKA